jgi:hypothetical protein
VPWTADHPPSVAKNTSQAERAACVKAANAALEDGESDEDAIFACIGAMNNVKAEPALTIKKQDDELQVVWGEVYAPGFPDSQGDFMTAETVREMAWRFMRKSDMGKIDIAHGQQKSGSFVVESFIARDDDSVFIPGAWVIGVKVPDPVIWQLIKAGELNGFSLDGFGHRTKTTIELEMPAVLRGETEPSMDGHTHRFTVSFDEEGNFLGGMTGPGGEDGHVHVISKGTITEVAAGHSHRFSFVEGVLDAQAAA